jgi:hypothetical protein
MNVSIITAEEQLNGHIGQKLNASDHKTVASKRTCLFGADLP